MDPDFTNGRILQLKLLISWFLVAANNLAGIFLAIVADRARHPALLSVSFMLSTVIKRILDNQDSNTALGTEFLRRGPINN